MAKKAAQWPADRVERRQVDALVPYARNARTHSPEQVDQLAASIREWGWTTPVLVDEADGIIAGHGRVLAAKKLRIADIPVMVARGWTDAQKRAYVIADNKLALNAGWDESLLKIELGELKALDFDLAPIGFSPVELGALFDPAAAIHPNAGSLTDRFLVAPFSVLNARDGWWQDRKRAWLALGIQSELGRGGANTSASGRAMELAGGFSARHGAHVHPVGIGGGAGEWANGTEGGTEGGAK